MANDLVSQRQLVEKVAGETGFEKKVVEHTLKSLNSVIVSEVSAGNTVVLLGLGRLSYRHRPARTVRNLHTGEPIQKAPDRTPRMSFSKNLKAAVNS